MATYLIRHTPRLSGEVEVSTAKNAVLPILAAGLLTEDPLIIKEVPRITDVETLVSILRDCGAEVNRSGADLSVCALQPQSPQNEERMRKLRASILILGPILARTGSACVGLPGGCAIGQRPIDLHLKGLQALGAQMHPLGGMRQLSGRLSGARIYLDLPSVGATENLVMTCVFLDGVSIIRNCAKEPEIVDLQNFLNAMGAKVSGAGTGVIKVEGVKKLHGTEYTPIPDRIVAGTYLIGVAMCGGELTLTNVNPEHLSSLLAKLPKSSCKITCARDKINMICNGRCESVPKVETTYYPGFPTDLQTQILTLQTVSEGTSVIVENIFETRFKTVPQLLKMGADVTVNCRTAVVRGVERLTGAEVSATDLRGGASLVLAGMCAQGETVVDNIGHIDRGYEDLSLILPEVGVKIKRV